MRLLRPLTWTAGLFTIGLYVVGAIVGLTSPPTGSYSGTFGAVWPSPFAVMAVVGAFVASRRPRNATGWMFLGGGFWMVVNGFAQSYGNSAITVRPGLPASHFIAWLALWTWMPAVVFIALVLELFPTGRPLGPFWRWVVRVEVIVLWLIPIAALPTLAVPTSKLLNAPSPASVPGGALVNTFNYPLPLLLGLGFVAVVVRFVRARGIERLQMKWFVFGASILALASVVIGVLGAVFHMEDPISNPLAAGSVEIGTIAVPMAAAIAILRYRLFDIDRVISRTVSYAIVTGGLLAAYVGLVVIFRSVLGPLTGSSDLAVAASTLVVAAAFVPVRRRVQAMVDRRFNRGRYDAARTIETFSTRLRDEIDIDALGAELEDVVYRTMQPAHVSIWMRTT